MNEQTSPNQQANQQPAAAPAAPEPRKRQARNIPNFTNSTRVKKTPRVFVGKIAFAVDTKYSDLEKLVKAQVAAITKAGISPQWVRGQLYLENDAS